MKFKKIFVLKILFIAVLCHVSILKAQYAKDSDEGNVIQAQAVFTVSESKRLIGRAVAQMPVVQSALNSGILIIAKGTTNTYIAEEILGKKIEHGALVSGKIYPTGSGRRLQNKTTMSEIVLIDGKVRDDLSLEEAVKMLKPGDVVIKGANLLDYENRVAGVLIGHPSSGTTGKIMPHVVGKKAHLIIPVGLEKLGMGNIIDVANKLRQPVESLNRVPSMFLLTGHIITEIEALKILADVSAFQIAGGGIGGAEGAVWLTFRGTLDKVNRALKFIEEIQGEPSFVE